VSDDDARANPPATVAGFITRATGYVADALRYWEPRRLIYNVALAAVVLGHLAVRWPESRDKLSVNVLLGFSFWPFLRTYATAQCMLWTCSCSPPACVNSGRRVELRC